MGGESIRQAKESLLLGLSKLNSSDRFNIIEFNSSHTTLYSRPVAASPSNISAATEFVHNLRATGGTEMYSALEAALIDETPLGYLKQVVFITDGSVGNEQALFKLIHDQLGNARLFTVGIGSAPNSYFMSKAAQFGRGTFTFIASTQDVAKNMGKLFEKLQSPVLGNISVQWPERVEVEMWPQRIPDLYAGEPLLISAKVEMLTDSSEVVISGSINSQPWRRSNGVNL